MKGGGLYKTDVQPPSEEEEMLDWIPASLIVYAWRYHDFIKSKRKSATEQEEKSMRNKC
jgi:hypothetical protein